MNIKYSKKLSVVFFAIMASYSAFADKNKGIVATTANKNGGNSTFAGCVAGNAQTSLDVNNINTTILTGGDFWWDGNSNPRYEVPKGSGLHSIYAGALWLGGVDAGGNIKIAAQTYRQTGDDMWPGAMNVPNVSIDPVRCKYYDRHWKVTKSEVQDFIDGGAATNDMIEWPGNGDIAYQEAQFLAPFFDADSNGVYSTDGGDYPYYNFSGVYPNNVCNDYVFGDETLWWVINDVGDAHTATVDGGQIGIEIRCQAFAFKTNDEINNMTFYKYQLVNRGTSTLANTYFGMWCDPDLGKATDDYVGCDVKLGLGYVYNGDADDDGAGGYGLNPPACGIDFFQGPLADPNDGIDNNKDGVIDEPGEQIIMSKFIYYNNVNNTPDGNPSGAAQHYKYLRGIWGDDQVITYGGNGRDAANPPCDYMFPGLTDPAFPTTDWTEVTAGNTPEDRRFMQSAGKFTLLPGAVNYITTGLVWARASSGGPAASVNLMKLADSKAQAIFDNCFQVLDGPSAPDVSIRELSNQLILTLENYNDSSVELYSKIDPVIPEVSPDSIPYSDDQRKYNFQGYILYQFKNATVTTNDIGNPNLVRTQASYQCDINDSITQLVNHYYDDNTGYWVPREMVNGANQGITHIFNITTDLFATGDPKLLNNTEYYFCVVSYATNEFASFVPTVGTGTNYTQSKPFFQGRNNIKTYTAIPHNPTVDNNGQTFGAEVGNSPIVTRIEGQGNCGMILDMQQASLNEALTPPAYRSYNPIYNLNGGPLNIKVFDPSIIANNPFVMKFDGVSDTSNWSMLNTASNKITLSERPIGVNNQQILGYLSGNTFESYGLASKINLQIEAGQPDAINNGFLKGNITYSNPNAQWINFIPNEPVSAAYPYQNWIKSASYPGLDPNLVYEKVLGGTWAPFKLCAKDAAWSPKWNSPIIDVPASGLSLSDLASVQVVFTSNKANWTRCVVLETCATPSLTQPAGSNTPKFNLRKSPSVDKNGSTAVGPDNNDYPTGMSWFPGYAINLETGERLNMAFGENSQFHNTMTWSPTNVMVDAQNNPVLGGMQYVYVFGHNLNTPTNMPRYDAGAYAYAKLTLGTNNDKKNVFKDCMWVTCPMLQTGQTLLSNDCKITLNVIKTFKKYDTRVDIYQNQTLAPNTTYQVLTAPILYNGTTVSVGGVFTTDATNLTFTGSGSVVGGPTANDNNPMYNFSTTGLENNTNNQEVASNALSLVNIVPNPYYAFANYERSQIDTRVRITNLPSVCKVSIFTLNGTLIRRYNRNAPSDNSSGSTVGEINTNTSLDWDLKNTKGIPVASGLYIINVDAPNLGSVTIKFFCVMRPTDLDTY